MAAVLLYNTTIVHSARGGVLYSVETYLHMIRVYYSVDTTQQQCCIIHIIYRYVITRGTAAVVTWNVGTHLPSVRLPFSGTLAPPRALEPFPRGSSPRTRCKRSRGPPPATLSGGGPRSRTSLGSTRAARASPCASPCLTGSRAHCSVRASFA